MAITIPAKLPIVPFSELVAAPMPGPLADALLGLNHMYWRHRPPLVSHAVTDTMNAVVREYVLPLPTPSQDGIRYDVRVPMQAAAVGTCTVETAYTTTLTPAGAVWTNLNVSAGYALINGFTIYQFTATIPRTATMLRLKVSAQTTDTRPTHILVTPDPDTAAAPFVGPAVTLAGWRPYDGTLLGTAHRPVTQELVNRCHRNTALLLRDRLQVAASLLCPLDRAGVSCKYPQTWAPAGSWVTVGRTPGRLPPSKPTTVTIRALASLAGGGATADRVEVAQLGGAGAVSSQLFAADGTVHSATMVVVPNAEGFVEWQVRVMGTAGQTVAVHAITIDWQAGQSLGPAAKLCGDGFVTPASLTLLHSAIKAVREAGLAAYACTAHMVDGATAGRTRCRAHVVIPRKTKTMRLVALRTTDGDTAVTTPATKLYGTTDGSIATPGIAISSLPALSGTDVYWDCQAAAAKSPAIVLTGSTLVSAPAAVQDRALAVTEDLITSLELVEVEASAGWCLFPLHTTADVETL